MLGVDDSSVGTLVPGFPALERAPCSSVPTPRVPTQKPYSFSELELESSCVARGRSLNLSEPWFPQLSNGGTIHPAWPQPPKTTLRKAPGRSLHLPESGD